MFSCLQLKHGRDIESYLNILIKARRNVVVFGTIYTTLYLNGTVSVPILIKFNRTVPVLFMVCYRHNCIGDHV